MSEEMRAVWAAFAAAINVVEETLSEASGNRGHPGLSDCDEIMLGMLQALTTFAAHMGGKPEIGA